MYTAVKYPKNNTSHMSIKLKKIPHKTAGLVENYVNMWITLMVQFTRLSHIIANEAYREHDMFHMKHFTCNVQ